MESVKPSVDLAHLKQLTKGDAALEREYAQNFVTEGIATIARLGSSSQNNNSEGWKEAAHALRESANRLGAEMLASWCLAAERAAHDANLCAWLLDQIKTEFEHARRFLREYGFLS